MKPSTEQCDGEDIQLPLFSKHFDERPSHLCRHVPVDVTGVITADVFAQFDEIVPLPPKHRGVISDPIPDDLAAGFNENLTSCFSLRYRYRFDDLLNQLIGGNPLRFRFIREDETVTHQLFDNRGNIAWVTNSFPRKNATAREALNISILTRGEAPNCKNPLISP
jgi:hypothetical protein